MYEIDAAKIYEPLHEARGKDFEAEAGRVAEVIRERRPDAGSLLDVACGTGAHLRRFAGLFDRVEGLDASEAMLAVAGAGTPGVPLHRADMRDFGLPRGYDAITCLFSSIGYLGTTEDLDAALGTFAKHLEPGGVVVIEPWWFPETFLDGYVASDAVEVEGYDIVRLSHSRLDGDASLMTVHYVIADAESGARHFTETHRCTLFEQVQYEDAFRRAGLAVEYVDGLATGRGLFVGVGK
ncbi:class I SAM-dependent methyltransferase [Actinomadura rugatobispora]|uniref:Class I SAM-dependent methyltransferase n=1 Tax=Actinomadura rugatobispora TaxID=1994 RepID=A0ABW1AH09_9ACTN|nr:class I SAM-dependent methyltransferase [Actinomadura rugatobispora]